MKRTLLTFSLGFLALGAVSCEDNSEEIVRYTVSANKFDSISIPKDTIAVNEILNISTFSTYKNWCDKFDSFDFRYSTTSLERKIALRVINDNMKTCGTAKSFQNDFPFIPNAAGTYTLKFWLGDDNWYIKDIVVQ